MNIMTLFAENMKRLRKQQGLTQEQLSEKSNLHRTYIGGIEQGRINVSLKNIEKIADALSVNPAFFFIKPNSQNLEGTRESSSPAKSTKKTNDNDAAIPFCAEPDKTTYYLCAQEGQILSIFSIEADNPDLTIQILCSLIQQGYEPDELYGAYKKTKKELIEFLNSKEGTTLTSETHKKEVLQQSKALPKTN